MKRVAPVIAVLALAALPAVALGSSASTETLKASLKGSSEVPGPGAPSGKGKVTITLNDSTGKVCWTFKNLSGLGGTPMAAHIHKGKASVAGPVVVPLGGAYKKHGCITAAKSLIKSIEDHPGKFYVNVHNNAYPNGAIRGQLTHP